MKRYRDIAGDGGSNIAGQVEAQQAKLRARLASVHHVVAILSGKGGVGKSAITANLVAVEKLFGIQELLERQSLPACSNFLNRRKHYRSITLFTAVRRTDCSINNNAVLLTTDSTCRTL